MEKDHFVIVVNYPQKMKIELLIKLKNVNIGIFFINYG